MRKFIRYLKPFAGLILGVVILLAVQAVTELLLPNYMSNIVNVGIQQGGFENGVPKAMTDGGMALLRPFMTAEQQKTLDGAFEKDGDVWRLKDVDEGTIESLDEAFGVAEWTLIYAIRSLPGGEEAMSSISSSGDLSDADISTLDMSSLEQLAPRLAALTPADFEQARSMAERVPDSMREQTGASFARLLSRQAGVDTDAVQSDYLKLTGVEMLGLALAAAVASILVGFLASRIGAGVSRKLRRDVFRRVESFSPHEINRFSTASLITRSTNDITQVQQFTMMSIRMLIFSPIMGIGGIVMALQKSLSMAWIIALAVVVVLCIIGVGVSIAMPKFKIIQKLIDKLNLVARENLTGLLVVRAFRTQEYEEDRFNKSSYELGRTMLFTNRVMVFIMPAVMLVMNLTSLLVVWIGAQQVEASALQIGDIMAYIQYVMIIIMSFLMIAAMFVMIPRAAVSIDRLFEVLDTVPEITTPGNPEPFRKDKLGDVEFDHVYFEYAGAEEPILKDISFTARPGEVTAIIGPTGCGKSTLINLIPRFYDVTRGDVKVSGVDVRKADLHELREEIGFVPQKGALFSGTIASNLRYGRHEATDEELMEAAEIAQAREFIVEKTDELNAPVAEGAPMFPAARSSVSPSPGLW